MNKREIIHMLIDQLLDIEESGTKKELYFSYMAKLGFDFHFSRGSGSSEYVQKRTMVYMKSNWDLSEQVASALKDIETIKNTPEYEPVFKFELTESKARELGLLVSEIL